MGSEGPESGQKLFTADAGNPEKGEPTDGTAEGKGVPQFLLVSLETCFVMNGVATRRN